MIGEHGGSLVVIIHQRKERLSVLGLPLSGYTLEEIKDKLYRRILI